uniref:Uncharacterized protein n=1 Tax=Cacopsylla melanoneura TaxID=428564 RepID=A0A8D8Z0J7_9HEMI
MYFLHSIICYIVEWLSNFRIHQIFRFVHHRLPFRSHLCHCILYDSVGHFTAVSVYSAGWTTTCTAHFVVKGLFCNFFRLFCLDGRSRCKQLLRKNCGCPIKCLTSGKTC